MGSYISIGMVYSENVNELHKDIEYLIKNNLQLSNEIIVNYPLDESCEKWESKNFEGDEFTDAFLILETFRYSTGKLRFKINGNIVNIIVSIRRNNRNIQGILFEVPEEDLMKNDYSLKNLNSVTDKIVNILINLLSKIKFDYAFCDNEVDIEYSLDEIEQKKEPVYSVIIKRNTLNEPIIQLSSWNIDGITSRKQE